MAAYRPTKVTVIARKQRRYGVTLTSLDSSINRSGSLKFKIKGGNELWLSEAAAYRLAEQLRDAYLSK